MNGLKLQELCMERFGVSIKLQMLFFMTNTLAKDSRHAGSVYAAKNGWNLNLRYMLCLIFAFGTA